MTLCALIWWNSGHCLHIWNGGSASDLPGWWQREARYGCYPSWLCSPLGPVGDAWFSWVFWRVSLYRLPHDFLRGSSGIKGVTGLKITPAYSEDLPGRDPSATAEWSHWDERQAQTGVQGAGGASVFPLLLMKGEVNVLMVDFGRNLKIINI